MDMKIIRWILIGIVVAIALGLLIVQPLIKKFRMERDNVPEQKTWKVTCTVPSCEVFYKRMNHDSRYCVFHDAVHEIYLKLVALDSPAKHRAEVYFNTNGMFYADENKQDEIIRDLEKELAKATKKPATKTKAAPKKTSPKKTIPQKQAVKKTVNKTTKK